MRECVAVNPAHLNITASKGSLSELTFINRLAIKYSAHGLRIAVRTSVILVTQK